MGKIPKNQFVDNGFAGKWSTFDESFGEKRWIVREGVISGNKVVFNDTSLRRPAGTGTIKPDGTAEVTFPDDPPHKYIAKLINDNTIEWNGDPGNRWFRYGLPGTTNLDNILDVADNLRQRDESDTSTTALRNLVSEWVVWIASGESEKTSYIEEFADKMRSTAGIVRHLVYQLGQQEFYFDNDLGNVGENVQKMPAEKIRVNVHRRVARMLAEMSDIKYFEKPEDIEKYDSVKKALINHAIPIIVPRLPLEDDIQVRTYFATTLGKLGESETVDALVRTVVSDEKVRASRQEMLAEFYLKPSREQGDQAAKILKGAVKEAKRTLGLLQWLNVIVFIAGMIILVGGLYVSITNENARVAGALAGIGGFAGVIGLLINDPLNRIQNSLSNLVQLEAAFTSFIWELNLNSTYIQSQYVAEGILREEDVSRTLARIEGAMDFTMSQVATYTDEGREVIVPHLTHLSPMIGKVGDTIHLYGDYIKVNGRTKETTGQIAVAINHIPFKPLDPPEKKNSISFELPVDISTFHNQANGNIWISLVINGVETNALPLSIGGANQD